MDLESQKRKMQAIAGQLKAEQSKTAEYNERAGGFGKELGDAIKKRDDTYRTLDNEVNTREQSYFNTMEDLLPLMQSKFKDDPIYGLNALGQERQRRGVSFQNSVDSRDRKKGSIMDLINGFVQTAGLAAQKQAQRVNDLNQDYGREKDLYSLVWNEAMEQQRRAEANRAQAFAEAQAAKADARYSQQMGSQQKGLTTAYLQALEKQGEDFATKKLTRIQDGVVIPPEIGSQAWNAARDKYLQDTLNRSKTTWGDAGYDSALLDNYLKMITPEKKKPEDVAKQYTDLVKRFVF